MAASPIKFEPGIQLPLGAAAGKVLTSDATGKATWQTPSGSDGATFAFFAAG